MIGRVHTALAVCFAMALATGAACMAGESSAVPDLAGGPAALADMPAPAIPAGQRPAGGIYRTHRLEVAPAGDPCADVSPLDGPEYVAGRDVWGAPVAPADVARSAPRPAPVVRFDIEPPVVAQPFLGAPVAGVLELDTSTGALRADGFLDLPAASDRAASDCTER